MKSFRDSCGAEAGLPKVLFVPFLVRPAGLLHRLAIKLVDEVGPADAPQLPLDVLPFFGLVPEEELPLRQLLLLRLRTLDGLQRIGVEARVPCFGADGHGRGGEVLHLFEVEVELLGLHRQLGHVCLSATGVAADEVRDDLLVQSGLAVDAVEDALEHDELPERGLPHEVQHAVARVFGCDLEPAADMTAYQFAGIVLCRLVRIGVVAAVQQEIVAHTAADEALPDARLAVDGFIDLEQRAVIGVEVGTDGRVNTRRAFAFRTYRQVLSPHGIHVGRGSSHIAQVAFEVVHAGNLSYLAEDALLAAARNELALMGTDGAEGASAETSAVDIDRMLDHVVGRNALAFVFRVGQTGVGQVEGGIDFLGRHGRIGRIDDDKTAVDFLQQATGLHLVGLLFDVPEVLGLRLLVAQAFFVRMQHDVGGLYAAGYVFPFRQIDRLRNVAHLADAHARFECPTQLDDGLFTHAVDDHVGPRVAQEASAELVLPVVVVRETPQRGFDTSQHDRHIGE